MVLGRSGFFVIKVVRVLEVCANGDAWRSDGRENAIVREMGDRRYADRYFVFWLDTYFVFWLDTYSVFWLDTYFLF